MFNWQVYLGFFLAVIAYFWWKKKPMRDLADKIPGPKGLPLIGMAHKIFGVKSKDVYQLFHKNIAPFLYEPIGKFWFGPMLVVIPLNPEDLKTIMNSDDCQDKPLFFYRNIFEFSMLSINGEKYKAHRKAVTPLFHPKSMRVFLPQIDKVIRKFLISFDAKLTEETLNIAQQVMDFSIDSTLTTLLDIEHIDEKLRAEFNHNLEESLIFKTEAVFKPWLKIDKMLNLSKSMKKFKLVNDKVLKFIESLMKDHENVFINGETEKPAKPSPFLGLHYTVRKTMTYQETLDSFLFFFAAGFDTTGKALPGALLLMAMNQDVQEKVFDEVNSILSSENHELDEELLSKMVYLDLVIKESLRLFPAGLMIGRQPAKNVNLSTCTVPKGAVILIFPLIIHTKKELWGEDALEFKPERFLDENIKKVHPYSYIPFSGGFRMCPGYKYALMAMKIFLSKFLLKYRVTTELKYKELEFQMLITTEIKQGFMVKIERR